MSMILTITDAGRQALVNAQNTGTLPLVISHVALGRARYNPAKNQLALQNEVKRVVSFGGGAVAPDVIHITVHDDSTDSYPLGEFGLITSTGVLFAVYSKPGEYILEKNANGILLLSVDTKITTLDITNIQFSGTNFVLPPGTTTVAGLLKLADSNEAAAGVNNTKAMTAKTTKEVVKLHADAVEAHHWDQIHHKPALVLEEAPISEITNANLYTRGGPWLTPAAGLVNFPQSIIDANTRAIVIVSGNNNGITQQVRSRNGDGRVFHRTAATFAGLVGLAWIEERNSKNTLDIGTTAASARAAIELPGWMGLGGGVHQITDMTSTDVNISRIFRMNGNAIGGNGNFTGVISLPGDGTPITGYLGVSLHGIPYVGRKQGVNALPTWNQIWDSNSQLALGMTAASARAAMGLAAIAATGNAADLLSGQLSPARLPFSYSVTNIANSVVQRDNVGDIFATTLRASSGIAIASTTPLTTIQDTDNPVTSMLAFTSYRDNTNTEVGWIGYGIGNGEMGLNNGARNIRFASPVVFNNSISGNGSGLTNLGYSQLPYAPVQQGGGVGQTTAKIYIGSSGNNEVKCAVDSTDQGAFAFKPWVTTNFAANHPTASFTEAQVGGVSALRQWSPTLIKAAADYSTAEIFGASKLNTLTLLAPAPVPNGQYVYWKVGKVAFAYYVIVVQAANQSGSVKIGAMSSHFPLNSGSALVHASPTSHLRLELTRSGELMVHYNNVTGTYDGLHSWRTD